MSAGRDGKGLCTLVMGDGCIMSWARRKFGVRVDPALSEVQLLMGSF